MPDRADDIGHTHIIMMNILRRIIDADMVLCDLSSKNPNVLYELGVRQAFDKPAALIKDDRTDRIFDTGMMSDFQYKSELRIDTIRGAIDGIALSLRNTYDNHDKQIVSLIRVMGISPAATPKHISVTPDTSMILDAIADIGRRLSSLEGARTEAEDGTADARATTEPRIAVGARVTIRRGPLKGITGTVLRYRGNHRYVVRIDYLQAGAAIEVNEDDLTTG